MLSITLVLLKNSNDPKIVSHVFEHEHEAFEEMRSYVSDEKQFNEDVKNGWIVTLPVDQRVLKKILKQEIVFVFFDYELNDNGYPVPRMVHASKVDLIKKIRKNKTNECDLFANEIESFTLSKNKKPIDYKEWSRMTGVKI